MSVLNDKSSFDKEIILRTIPLRKVNDNLEPIGIGSGFIVTINGVKLIVSAEHVINRTDGGNWCIECEYEPKKGKTKLQKIGTPSMALRFNLKGDTPNVLDISCQKIPNDFVSVFQEFSNSGTLQNSESRKEFDSLTYISPNLDDIYAFTGNTKPCYGSDAPQQYLETTWRVYNNLKFKHSTTQFDYYELPFEHPGHVFFEGCSGAPLVNQRFEVVGLISGCDDGKLIKVLPLRKYLVMIKLEAGCF